MRRIFTAILILMIISSSIPFVTSARVAKSPLTVVLTYPGEEFVVGDEVPVQVHVFRHSVRYDPDEVDLRVGVNLTSYPMERLSTGLFEATVEIRASDQSKYGNLRLEVTVNKTGPYPETDEFKTWLRLPDPPTYSIHTIVVDPTTMFPERGEVIEVLVVCKYGDQLVDADPGSVRVKVDEVYGRFEERINVTRVSTGMYRGNWTVSVDMNKSGQYNIGASARFGSEGPMRSGEDTIIVSPLEVWINFLEASRTSVLADIYVRTEDGDPMAGMNVSVDVHYDHTQDVQDTLALETGHDGVAHLFIDLEPVEPPPFEVYFEIVVSGDDIHHEAFWGVVTDPLFARPGFSEEGFAVTSLEEVPVPAGSEVSLDLLATIDAEPLGNETIDCYIYSDHAMIASTEVRTDADGLFGLDVTTPSISSGDDWVDIVDCVFKIRDGGPGDWTVTNIWVSDYDYWAKWYDHESSETHMDIETTSTPHEYKVTLRSDVADGLDERVVVQWRLGNDYRIVDITDPGWYPLSLFFLDMVFIKDLSWTGDAYVGTLVIPDILPEDAVISISGYVQDPLHPDLAGWAAIEDLYEYLDNSPPTLEITSPKDGDLIEAGLVVRGTASDEGSVESVLVRLDDGEWETANGTESWSLVVPEDRLVDGPHTIEAKAFDGSRYSEAYVIEIEYVELNPEAFEPWPMVILMVLIVGVAVTVFVIRSRRP